jgi:acyl-CoA thioesterase-1
MKSIKFLYFLLFLLIAACTSATPTPLPTVTLPPTATPIPTAGTIVALGDSLTEGMGVDPNRSYPAQLERKLHDNGYNWTVINGGVSGETSSGARSRVDWVIDSLQPDIVILATGGNDSLRATDPAVTEQNLREIVETLQAADVTVILAGMQTVQNMGQEYTDAFRAIYPQIAEEYGLPLIPFLLEGVAGDPKLNQDDFIHPTAEGYTIVVETVYPYVVAAIERE